MLIAVVGKKGDGKDTFAQPLVNRQFMKRKMADPLKNMLRELYRTAGLDDETIERKVEGDLKEVPCEILCGKTPRFAMQKLGHEWRNFMGEDLWTRIWETKVSELLMAGIPVVCTDVRYHHEVEAVERLGGYLVRVRRSNRPDDGDDHESEKYIDDLSVHAFVENNETPKALHKKAIQVMEDLTK